MKRILLALLMVVLPFANAYAQTKELVVAAFGGAYTDALKKNVATFEKENNVKVTFIPASGADGLAKAMAREVDVIHADMGWGVRGEMQNAFEKLDPKLIPNLAKVYPKARFSEYGVITNFGQYGIAYNPKLMKEPPTSWNDFLKPEMKGRVTTAGFDAANIEWIVLYAKQKGGSEDNIDAGFKTMAQVGRNVTVFYSQHPQLLDLFRNEEVAMARWLRGRVTWANQQGVALKFVVPKEGALALVSTVHVVKGRPNTELAQKFVNYLLSEQPQRTYATELGYTPARQDLDLKGVDVPYGQAAIDELVLANWYKVVPKMDSWKGRWDKEVAR